jgi:hypothetical protein
VRVFFYSASQAQPPPRCPGCWILPTRVGGAALARAADWGLFTTTRTVTAAEARGSFCRLPPVRYQERAPAATANRDSGASRARRWPVQRNHDPARYVLIDACTVHHASGILCTRRTAAVMCFVRRVYPPGRRT